MRLYFTGHNYRYAAEQMLLTLFPLERPTYPSGKPSGDRAELTLCRGSVVCRLTLSGVQYDGTAEIETVHSDIERVRSEQRAVKLAFYRAALSAGVPKPIWGALTGVKPGKLMARYLTEGKTAADFAHDFDVDMSRALLCEKTSQAALAAGASLAPGDAALYIGIPFCPTRCSYCSFVSSAVGAEARYVEPYLAALFQEIRQTGDYLRAAGQRPVALYIGGGTPTTLSPEQLNGLFVCLENSFDLTDLRENTVEAGRPDTITAAKLSILAHHGVTRVSVNPQSMSDEVLRSIGRRHTTKDIKDAMDLVRAVGVFAVNMDLIAGLPKDTPQGFAKSLDAVLRLSPENITIHTLSIKNGSRLAQQREELPDGTAVGEMIDMAAARLSETGYEPYYLYRQKYMSGGFENVGWALPGTGSLYNILMMEELCPVFAMGAGASSKFPNPDGSIRRKTNPKYPKEYIERMMSHGL